VHARAQPHAHPERGVRRAARARAQGEPGRAPAPLQDRHPPPRHPLHRRARRPAAAQRRLRARRRGAAAGGAQAQAAQEVRRGREGGQGQEGDGLNGAGLSLGLSASCYLF